MVYFAMKRTKLDKLQSLKIWSEIGFLLNSCVNLNQLLELIEFLFLHLKRSEQNTFLEEFLKGQEGML